MFSDWLQELFPNVVRVGICHGDIGPAIQETTRGRIFRFVKRPFDIPLLVHMLKEALERYQGAKHQSDPTPLRSVTLSASGRLPAMRADELELASLASSKRQVTFRIVKSYMKALKREATEHKFDNYSPYLELILRKAFKTLRKSEVPAEERTRRYKRNKKQTITFYLNHGLVRIYHVLANQLGYANTSELVNEVLEKYVVLSAEDEDTDAHERSEKV